MPFSDTRVGGIVLSIAEFVPLMAFVYAGRANADIATRFFWGAGGVLAIVPILLVLRWRLNPMLVAVGIWLCIEAFAFLVDVPPLAAVLTLLQESAFFVPILAIGAGYVAWSRYGLFASRHDDAERVRRYSFVLMALALAGLGCSVLFRGQEMYAAIVPGTILFVSQSLMSAHLRDRATS